MRKLLLLLSAVICLSACGESDPLASLSKQCEIDLGAGQIVYESDTHGGFHNDGCRLLVVQYGDDFESEEMQANAHWHPLPLTENLSDFFYRPYDDTLQLPKIEHGYYYFMDRHTESCDPYDDSELFSRCSFNFTAAIFDADTKSLYFVQYDT